MRSELEATLQRRTQVDARIVEIDANPVYVDRALTELQGEQQHLELQPHLDNAIKELSALRSVRGLSELLDNGYETAAYLHRGPLRFFKRAYLRDWKRADELIVELGVTELSEVRTRRDDLSRQVAVLSESLYGVRRAQDAVRVLVDERERLEAERAALPAQLQIELGEELAAVIRGQGREAMQPLLANPVGTLAAYAEVDGVAHQISYSEASRQKINDDATRLNEQFNRLRAEHRRYESNRTRYRNKQFSDDQFAKRFNRANRWDKSLDRHGRTNRSIFGFNDYSRGAAHDMLWWDLMTDGRIDGNFIPEVSEWRESHPDYQYEREPRAATERMSDDPSAFAEAYDDRDAS